MEILITWTTVFETWYTKPQNVVVSVFVPANPASQLKEICVVANMNADAMYLAPIASVKDLAFLALVDKSPQITISAPKVP